MSGQPLNRLLSDSAVYGLSRVALMLRSLAVVGMFAALADEVAYSVFTQALIFVGMLGPIATLRLDAALVRCLAGDDNRLSFRSRMMTGLWVTLVGALAAAALSVALAGPIAASFFDEPEARAAVMAAGGLLVAMGLGTYTRGCLRTVGQIKLVAGVDVLQAAMEVAAAAAALAVGYGALGVVAAYTLAQGIVAVGLTALVIRRFGLSWRDVNWRQFRPVLAFGAGLVPNGPLTWAIRYADRLVIVHVMGLSEVGRYAVAYLFAELIGMTLTSVNYAFYPRIARLWSQGQQLTVQRELGYVCRAVVLLASPVALAFTVLAEPAVSLLPNENFQITTVLVLLVTGGTALNGIYLVNNRVFHLMHRLWIINALLGAAAALNIGLNLLFVPRYGLIGAAATTAITYLLLSVASTLIGRRYLPYPLDAAFAGKVALATGAAATAMWWIGNAGWLQAALALIAGLGIYSIIVYFTRALSSAELETIAAIVRPRRSARASDDANPDLP